MAFWGIEVKPGKPYIHSFDSDRGRLRISQATLGIGKSNNKSMLQCNVGNKSPILLCNLIPNVSETCHLELEFEEDEDVIFLVLGQTSVHLSGYYVGGCSHDLDGDGTDSYGEDISGTDPGSYSSYDDEEDEYESDFIDDDGMGMFPASSPQRKSGVVIEELVEDDKPFNGNANHRLSKKKKKNKTCSSDDVGDDSKRQLVVKSKRSAILESEDEDGFPISSSRRKNDANGSKGNSKSDDKTVNEKSMKKEKKKKAREEKPLETEDIASVEPELVQDKEVGNKADEVQSEEEKLESKRAVADGLENDSMTKKKKKKTKKGKATESVSDISVERTEDKAIKNPNESADNKKMDQDLSNSQLEVPSPAIQESGEKLKKKNKKKRAKDDRGSDAEGGKVADVNQTDAKRKKKEGGNSDKNLAPTQESGELGESEATKGGLGKPRSFPNGLIIEELAMGKPDGKRATPGKKVSVKYIGKLKNGKIFDSNVGKRPFDFRLGIGQVIKGWDVGVNGMRVGDKRRLTIPPSYGYEEKAMGPIPPNSWLMFDVELVSVK